MIGMGGRPLGLGPVFAFEWLTGSRRWQGYALRSLFVAALLVTLVVIWSGRSNPYGATTIRQMAKIGENFYLGVVGTQLTLVLLAAPAATAGAICLDRSRGTLTHLLLTDLNDSEIVLGKLAARLVPVLGLVGCTLPVLALLTLMGGVDPDSLLAAFVVTVGVAVFGCSLALIFSLFSVKTHEAILGTYAVWGLWLLDAPILRLFNQTLGLSLTIPSRFTNPYTLCFAPYWHPKSVGWEDFAWFLGACWLASAALAGVAVWRLRAVSTRENVKSPRKRTGRLGKLLSLPDTLIGLTRKLPGPSLDFNPVLWREWHRSRPSRWVRIVIGIYVTLAVAFSVSAIATGSVMMSVFVNGFQVAIGLLLLSVTSATALAEERVRGSLDVLMTTPLSTHEIVVGKWLGSFRVAPLLAVLPALVVLSGDRWGFWQFTGAGIMTAYVLACSAAITSLGLAMATWCSRLGRAVGLTVAAYVVLSVGLVFFVMATMNPRPLGWAVIMGSPFYGSVGITVELTEARFSENVIGWAIPWVFIYGFGALALLAATVVSFNDCLGRVEEGLFSLRHHRRRRPPVTLRRVVKVNEPLGIVWDSQPDVEWVKPDASTQQAS